MRKYAKIKGNPECDQDIANFEFLSTFKMRIGGIEVFTPYLPDLNYFSTSFIFYLLAKKKGLRAGRNIRRL